jgi:aminomuconate-semialdehyde/2-hydroxymuconate-6-semialdehyde dehydrogenase
MHDATGIDPTGGDVQRMGVISNYIGGRFDDIGARFPDINPVDGQVITQVVEADRETVDAAVAAARRALKAGWADSSAQTRAGWLRRIADGIEARFDDFVQAEMRDTGKPLRLVRELDVPRGIAHYRIFADLVVGAANESFETELADGSRALNYTVRKPLGVLAIVSPWNLPLLLTSWKIAPALAAGNTVIVKPSEETPATAFLLAEVCHAIGLPPGVFNLVNGFGPNSAGEFLTAHPDVDAVTFTGESATGSAIMRAAAATVKPISFELGGKNAAIVFADCDFDAAVAGTARSTFLNTGQVCLCTERVYVERPIFNRFIAALKTAAEHQVLGVPTDPATTMGPLISAKHREKVVSYYRLARDEGAVVVTGGGIPVFGDARDGGAFVEPTILTGLPETARCVKEEIFGPVCHIAPFDTEEQAIAMANDSRYGLAAAVWTQNLSRAHRVARRMETGIAWVNSWFLRDLRTPFGGVKLSGIGREGGLHSLAFYSEPMNICVKL